jgi:hypothetical protein
MTDSMAAFQVKSAMLILSTDAEYQDLCCRAIFLK